MSNKEQARNELNLLQASLSARIDEEYPSIESMLNVASDAERDEYDRLLSIIIKSTYEKTSALLQRYDTIYRTITEKYRSLLLKVQPELGDYAFAMAHNWGNAEAKNLLSKYDKVSSYICKRRTREYNRLEHKLRHFDSKYLWCCHCKDTYLFDIN